MTSTRRTIGQFGCGYWGPNLLRNFVALPDVRVKVVVDPSGERRKFVQENFPQVHTTGNPEEAWRDPEIDAVVIATPAGTHFELTMRSLEAGKHVLVEKPLCTSLKEVDAIAQAAAEKRLVVMAGHTFVYNAAVRYVKGLIDRGELGDVRCIYSQRVNFGRIRSDVDALWNLAPHDISIIQYWLDDLHPVRVSRRGMAWVQPDIEDTVFLNLEYRTHVIANIHVSWLDPQKVRKIVVVGSRKMVLFDDVSDDKVAIYDRGIDRKAVLGVDMDYDKGAQLFQYRAGDVLLPKIDFVEPLRAEAKHFLECVRSGQEPLTGLRHARSVVNILEKASDKDERAPVV